MVLATVALFFPGVGSPQAGNELSDLKKDVEALKAGQAGIQKDLQEIKTLLRQAPARPQAAAPAAPAAPPQPQNVVLSVEGAPFKGQKDAKVTLIEFTDFQ